MPITSPIRGRQRRQERHRTTALINEYKSCTSECSVLTACSPSSSLIRRGNSLLGFYGQREHQTTKFDNLCLPSRLKLLHFSVRESCAKSKGKVYRWSQTENLNEKYFSWLQSSLLPSSFLKVPKIYPPTVISNFNNNYNWNYFHLIIQWRDTLCR